MSACEFEAATPAGRRSVSALALAAFALAAVLSVGEARAESPGEPRVKYSFTTEFGAEGVDRRPKSSWLTRVRAKGDEADQAEAKPQADAKPKAEARSRTALARDEAKPQPASKRSRPAAQKQTSPEKLLSAEEAKKARALLAARLKERAKTVRIQPVAAKGKKASTAALAPAGDPDDDIPVSFAPEVADPLESLNRGIFAFNEGLDMIVFRPVSMVYRTAVHSSVRFGISNALHNFSTPVIFANDLLQGRPSRAGKTLMRFLINSTAGFGGLADAAAAGGLERHSEDFGQTLAVWGMGPGIYLVIPVIGPTTTRDGIGRVVDLALDPATWLMWEMAVIERLAPTIAYAVSGHEELMDDLDSVRKTSPDFYISMRDLYMQKRASEIANGAEALQPIEPEPNR